MLDADESAHRAGITEIKHHLDGRSQTFLCDLLLRGEGVMVLRFQTSGSAYAAVARTTEAFFWEGRNYLIYRMFSETGELVGHRFDVCRGVRFGEDTLEWTDLLLDFFVTPAGELQALDEEEVAEAVALGRLDLEGQAILRDTRFLLEHEYTSILQEAALLWAQGASLQAGQAHRP